MQPSNDFEVVRDPLWKTIRLDSTALRIIDTPEFQRLRHIRQLGLAYLVYPGATHTRFDHALGVYHLSRQALALLSERGDLEGVDPVDCRCIPYAALLHDIGHYPFSHALEELNDPRLPEMHEALTARFLAAEGIRHALESVAPDAPARVEDLIRGRSDSPLQGLVSGSLDLDKIEYLRRDAMFCGVPYGEVDADRLIHAFALVEDPATGRVEVGIHEKGLSALESLLFSKYQMFRNVYWHHAVRTATVLFTRMARDALDAELIQADDIVGQTDERFLAFLEARAAGQTGLAARRVAERWLPALLGRRLPKRALEIPGESLQGRAVDDWINTDTDLRHALEERLAAELSLPENGVLLDYPEKERMLGLDLLLLRRGGEAQRLSENGRAGLIGLPRVAGELYHTARVFRVFTVERRTLEPECVLPLFALSASELHHRLAQPTPLL